MTEPNILNYKKVEWYLEKFSPAVVVIIAAFITMMLDKDNMLTAIGVYVSFLFATIITTALITGHFNKKHSNPIGCQTAIDLHCTKIDELHCKYSQRCEAAIETMNSKVSEQNCHFTNVDRLVANAKLLERMYVNAVAKRLRTNKQVAEIEASAKSGTEIYIMTSGFLIERYEPDMRKAIVTNINRGVKYRYIIPAGKETEFEQMVVAIYAHEDLGDSYKKKKNDFLTAAIVKSETFMLTIAYYELPDERCSAVIVKLPADTLEEVAESEALSYLVPEGKKESHGKHAPKTNCEHEIFKSSLIRMYRSGKKNGELAFLATELQTKYKEGVEICSKPSQYAVIKFT